MINDLRTDSNVVVSVKNVSKKFCKKLRRSMAYGIVDLSKNLVGLKPDFNDLRRDEFWAIDDVSFELRRGEILGLIGLNGSGKSTLLRLLTGILPPDKGEIEIKGRVSALIAVGAGFHPHMTGRENIFLNGTILGMSNSEIKSKFQDIVDFAEIEEFLDAPVSTYSSGMRVRLGFSIAIQVEPDILLIDEVLAVGDIEFRAKCYNAIAEISKKASVIFVSHAMQQVSRICTDLIVLDYGRIEYNGSDFQEGLDNFYSIIEGNVGVVAGSDDAELLDLEFESNGVSGINTVEYLSELIVHIKFKLNKELKDPTYYLTFLDKTMQGVANCNTRADSFLTKNICGEVCLKVVIKKFNLTPGMYFVSVGIQQYNPFRIIKQYFAYKQLKVSGDFVSIAPVQINGDWSSKW